MGMSAVAQGSRWVGAAFLLCSLGACSVDNAESNAGPKPSSSDAPRDEPVRARPGSTGQREGSSGDWSGEQVLNFAAKRVGLQINRSGTAVESRAESEGAVDLETALASAKRFSNPGGDLAGAALALATSPAHSTGNGPTIDHDLVWILIFHVKMPKYSDVTMAMASSPPNNPLVDALDTFVIDAGSGEAYFASAQ